MADNVENLVLEQLRAIRSAVDHNGERLDRVEMRLSAVEQNLGHLVALGGADRDSVRSLERRIERIERRLEISDSL